MEILKLHDTISFYRKKQNLTQEALAQKLGVTNQSVSKWESAQCYPDISLIPQLAEIFGISIDELFGKSPKVSAINDMFYLRDNTFRIVVAKGKEIVDVKELNQAIDITFPKNCNETTRQYFKVEVFGNIVCDASINGDVVCHGNIECNQINGEIQMKDSQAMRINCNIISGDVRCHGSIACNQINGDATTFGSTLSCKGNINGDVRTFPNGSMPCGDISCGNIAGNVNCDGNIESQAIEGDVVCQGNLSCGGSIEGDVNCGNNISCAGNINGNVNCGDNVACGDNITGDVFCGSSVECKTIEGNVECQGNIIYK